MFILRKEHYTELMRQIEEIRSEYPMKAFEIEYRFNRMVEQMLDLADYVSPADLVSGGQYGIPEFSPRATAFRKDKTAIPNHGDIYNPVWTWIAGPTNMPEFTSRSAWGSVSTKTPAQVRLVVEFP